MQEILRKLYIADDAKAVGRQIARRITNIVRDKPGAILGSFTGNTSIAVYEAVVSESVIELARDGLDFSQVTLIGLDEYFPIDPHSPLSFRSFLQRNLLNHVKFRAVHLLDGGSGTSAEIVARCLQHDEIIRSCGGIDFSPVGIGSEGHVGFHERGLPIINRTSVVPLADTTRQDAAKDFGGIQNTPRQGITMDIGMLLKWSRQIGMVITGAHKADIAYRALTEPKSVNLPASLLRSHEDISYFMDSAAAAKLLKNLPTDLIDDFGSLPRRIENGRLNGVSI